MSEASHEQIKLGRVQSGLDLWSAIEAAQYGHVLDHDEPRSAAEREAISAFARSFARWVEEWEQRPQEVQSGILDELGRQLARLGEERLSLFAATIEREVETEAGSRVRMPIALLRISHSQATEEKLSLPAETRAR